MVLIDGAVKHQLCYPAVSQLRKACENSNKRKCGECSRNALTGIRPRHPHPYPQNLCSPGSQSRYTATLILTIPFEPPSVPKDIIFPMKFRIACIFHPLIPTS